MTDLYASYFSGRCNASAVSALSKISEALVEVLFSEEKRDVQVFIFLDEEGRRKITERLDLQSESEFKRHLFETLRTLPVTDNDLPPIPAMALATGRWRANGDLLATPPALPLLLLFSYAAEAMGEDDNVAAHNYYARLEDCLVSGDKKRLSDMYTDHWSELWGSYRDWLEAWDGMRGRCTVIFPEEAEHENTKYVQMAISQAILRAHDRENLAQMFDHFNLDSSMPIEEDFMRAIIEQWLTTSYCNPRIKKMWKKGVTRLSIVRGAKAHLAQWSRSPEGTRDERFSLGLSVQRNQRTKSLTINLDVLTKSAIREPRFEVFTESQEWEEVPIFEVEARRHRVNGISILGVEPVLQEVISGRVTHRSKVILGKRVPRAIVPLLLQPATREYTESPSLLINTPHALLVRTDHNDQLLAKVLEVLNTSALPGWRVLPSDERQNLPDHWEFIDGVQIVRPPSVPLPGMLAIFQVIPTSLIHYRGGHKVSGVARRWLADHPPQIIGSFPDTSVIEMRLSSLTSDTSSSGVAQAPVVDGVCSLDLDGLDIPPGAFEVITIESDGSKAVRGMIQLVSSSQPDATALNNPRSLASPLGRNESRGHLSSQNLPEVVTLPHLVGMSAYHLELESSLSGAPVPKDLPSRGKPSATDTPSEKIQLRKETVSKCAMGEAHNWVLDKQDPEKPVKEDRGRCKDCGLIDWHSRRAPIREVAPLQGKSSTVGRVGSRPPEPAAPIVAVQSSFEQPRGTPENWNIAFDALCFLLQGSQRTMAEVCSQITPGALAASNFWKALLAYGHLEIKFNEHQILSEWRVTEPTLVTTGEHSGFLSGYRSAQLLNDCQDLLKKYGYEIQAEAYRGFVDTWRVVKRDDGAPKITEVDVSRVRNLRVEHNLTRRVISHLAPLSAIRDSLPRIQMYGLDRKRWNEQTWKWDPRRDTECNDRGAYRTASITTSYFLNERELLLDQPSRLATYDLIKHLASQMYGQPLAAYDPDRRTFRVPQGTELPRLYARALIACSGVPPKAVPVGEQWEIHYPQVPQVVAQHLYWLLSN
jgi:hypothetical protein